MLLGVFSVHYGEAFAATLDWDSNSDEETQKDDDIGVRLRAGGSTHQNLEKQGSRNRADGLKRNSDSDNARGTHGKTSRSGQRKPLSPRNVEERNMKINNFYRLRKRFSSARNSILRQKKRKCCALKNVVYNEVFEDDNIGQAPRLESSKALNNDLPCDDIIPQSSKGKFRSNKSLLIPDLNLRVQRQVSQSVAADVTNGDYKKESIHFIGNKIPGHRTIESTTLNVNIARKKSVLLYPVNIQISENFEKNSELKKIELMNVPPERANETKDTNSLPLLIGKSPHHKDVRAAKTAVSLRNRRKFPGLRRHILTACDSSLYNLDNVKTKSCNTVGGKSSKKTSQRKQSISITCEVVKTHVDLGSELKMEPWSRLPEDLISVASQESVTVKYLFKKGCTESDGTSTKFWQKRKQRIEYEEKRYLCDYIPAKTSASSYIPLVQEDHIENSALRIHVLVMFCVVTSMQSIVSSTWSSIADSVMFAYPDCKARSVSLLSHWGSLCLLISIVPACYLLHKKGLRTALLVACSLCTLGAGVRCVPVRPDHFIFLAHVGSILNGIGGVVYGPAIVMLSSTWFPANERTFATSVGTSLSMLGSAATYYLGPLIVSDPNAFPSEMDTQEEVYYEDVQAMIQDEIFKYMKYTFISQLCFFLMLVLFFPDRPKYPTSKASSMSISLKIPCLESLKVIINNRQLVLLSISSAMLNGVATPWLSLLSMTLTPLHISQSVAAHIGFWTIICGCVMSLAVSKLSDWYPGYLKECLITFGLLSTLMFTWVSLMIGQILPYTANKLLVAIMIGISSVWATSPLFYELGAEVAYPAPESIITGFLFLVTNLTVAIFNAFLYFFHTSNISWLSYTLGLFALASTMCLCLVSPVYRRSLMDIPKI